VPEFNDDEVSPLGCINESREATFISIASGATTCNSHVDYWDREVLPKILPPTYEILFFLNL
jgi:hypothetical protein